MSVTRTDGCKALAIISSVAAFANSKTPAVALADNGSPIAMLSAFPSTLARHLP